MRTIKSWRRFSIFFISLDIDRAQLNMCTDDPGYASRKEQFKLGTIRKLHEGVYVEGWPKPSGKYVVLASGTMQKAAYHAKR